jgi:hypothetical protein
LFDFGCDVFHFAGDAAAESSSLGDVGDAVGDGPGFVAMAEAVEGQTGSSWCTRMRERVRSRLPSSAGRMVRRAKLESE